MKIGIVTTWFERGAAYVSRQFMEQLQMTDEVFIYARGGEKYAKDDPKWNLPNVHWGKRSMSDMKIKGSTYLNKKDFKKWIDNNNLELLFFNEQRWFPVLLWCKEWGIRTAAYVDYYTEKLIPYYNLYDCLICNTKRHAFAFRNNPNTKYIKWGTNIDVYKPQIDSHNNLYFFNSAGMDPVRKGTDLVIRAFSKLKNKNGAKLLVHTQVPLSKVIPEVQPLIDELLSEGSLEIVEKTISAPGLYYKADVYVYPSRLDGIGLTLMEAAASGLACITIDNAPMNEFVDESFGRLCNVDYYYSRYDGYYWPLSVADVASLSQIMERFTSGEENLAEMKIKARKYAERELDFSNNMKPLHSIFEETEFHYNETDIEFVRKNTCSKMQKMESLKKPFWALYFMVNKKARPFR